MSGGRAVRGHSRKSSADARKAVIDTNIYVDWLNERLHEHILFERGVLRYLSAVVLMELAAGARATRDRRLLKGLFSAFHRAGRVLLPSVSVFEETGIVLAKLRERRGYDLRGAYSLTNDVLIALSARSIGATVITQNAADFEAIRSIRPFSLAVVA